MDATNGLKETTRVIAPVASNTLGVNIFTAPGKAMGGERPRPFGEPFGFDPITSTLIFGEHDAVPKKQNQRMSTVYRNWSRQ